MDNREADHRVIDMVRQGGAYVSKESLRTDPSHAKPPSGEPQETLTVGKAIVSFVFGIPLAFFIAWLMWKFLWWCWSIAISPLVFLGSYIGWSTPKTAFAYAVVVFVSIIVAEVLTQESKKEEVLSIALYIYVVLGICAFFRWLFF